MWTTWNMYSIMKFLSDKDWRLSNLIDIDKRIANKTIDYIKREHPEIYSRIENTTIPITRLIPLTQVALDVVFA